MMIYIIIGIIACAFTTVRILQAGANEDKRIEYLRGQHKDD